MQNQRLSTLYSLWCRYLRKLFLRVGCIFIVLWGGAYGGDFITQEVTLDQRAPSALEARELGLHLGEKEAIIALIQKISPQDSVKVHKFTESEISNLVEDFEVFDERQSQDRYRARVVYRFKKRDLERLLGQEVPLSQEQSPLVRKLFSRKIPLTHGDQSIEPPNPLEDWMTIKDHLLIRYDPLSTLANSTSRTLAILKENGIKPEDLSGPVLERMGIPFVKLNEELGYCLMLDYGDSFIRVSTSMLENWDASFTQAMEVAQNNLNQSELIKEKIAPRAWKISSSQALGAHIFLSQLDNILSLIPNPLVFIPTIDQIFVVDPTHRKSLEKTVSFLKKIADQSEFKWVTGLPFLITEHGDFQTVDVHSFGIPGLEELEFYSRSLIYEGLETIKDSLIDQLPLDSRPTDDCRVGNFELVVDLYPEARPYMSMTTVFPCAEGLTLIPEVDLIALFNISGDPDEPIVAPRFILLDEVKESFPQTIQPIPGPPPCYLLDGKALNERLSSKEEGA